MRFTAGILLLAFQVVMIGVARVHPARFYTWAPFDSQNEYVVRVTIAGRELSEEEIVARYRRSQRGLSPRSLYEVVSTFQYVEEHYHPADKAQVVVTYRTNGSRERTWHWPPR